MDQSRSLIVLHKTDQKGGPPASIIARITYTTVNNLAVVQFGKHTAHTHTAHTHTQHTHTHTDEKEALPNSRSFHQQQDGILEQE